VAIALNCRSVSCCFSATARRIARINPAINPASTAAHVAPTSAVTANHSVH
jgi:hypothetical protein